MIAAIIDQMGLRLYPQDRSAALRWSTTMFNTAMGFGREEALSAEDRKLCKEFKTLVERLS